MTKRNHSPKSRPVAALLIVAATLFLLAGSAGSRPCGVLGALLSTATTRLLGAAGTGLLCVTAWCIAFILATPPGTFTRMVVTIWHAVKPKHRPSVVVVKKSAVESVREMHETIDEGHVVSPRVRQNLDAVRSALKNLDFNKSEYEPIVAQMDGTQPFEKLVKGALAKLREVN